MHQKWRRLLSYTFDTFQVIEESEEDMAMRMRAAMSTSTPPSSPAVIRGEKLRKSFSLISE